MRIRKSATSGHAIRIRGITAPRVCKSPRQNAIQFIKDHHDLFGLSVDLAELRFERACPTPFGFHVFFQQYHGRTPIGTAWLRVDLDSRLNTVGAYNGTFPQSVLRSTLGTGAVTPTVKSGTACKLVLARLRHCDEATLVGNPSITIRPRGKLLVPAWKIEVAEHMTSGTSHAIHYVDASAPRWLFQRQSSFRAAEASIFQPNPIVSLNRPDLPASVLIPEIAYQKVPLLGLQGATTLDGLYVSTDRSAPPRVQVSESAVAYRRGTREFLELMSYIHIDAMQRYLQSLGFTRAHARQIHINVTASTGQSSQYLPTLNEIRFATGGIPDCEDGEIIVHEYAHAVHSDIYPAFGTDTVSINLAEGFSDYLAVSFFADRKSDSLLPCFASWDARADQPSANPPALRRLDRTTTFSQINVHGRNDVATEFWGSCLLDVRKLLGRQTADTVIVGSLFVMERNRQSISFFQAAKGICDAFELGYGRTQNLANLQEIFRRRGVFL